MKLEGQASCPARERSVLQPDTRGVTLPWGSPSLLEPDVAPLAFPAARKLSFPVVRVLSYCVETRGGGDCSGHELPRVYR
jgi:hypothetical protein